MHIILLSRGHGAARSLNLDLRLIVAVAVLLLVGTLVGGVALGSWLTPTVRSPEPDGAARVLSEKLAQLTASRQDAQRQLDAFSAHVADLQVRLTRLDVLGARLTELADVDASEFDFSLAAGRGGPEEPLEGDEYRVPPSRKPWTNSPCSSTAANSSSPCSNRCWRTAACWKRKACRAARCRMASFPPPSVRAPTPSAGA